MMARKWKPSFKNGVTHETWNKSLKKQSSVTGNIQESISFLNHHEFDKSYPKMIPRVIWFFSFCKPLYSDFDSYSSLLMQQQILCPTYDILFWILSSDGMCLHADFFCILFDEGNWSKGIPSRNGIKCGQRFSCVFRNLESTGRLHDGN